MLSTVAVLLLACRMPSHPPPPPPPPVTIRCEGADQVRRNHDGIELSRNVNACTVTRCEGADRVRRTVEGLQVSRVANACVITRCEGDTFVTRTLDGRWVQASRRCMPWLPHVEEERPAPTSTPDPLRFGLSYR